MNKPLVIKRIEDIRPALVKAKQKRLPNPKKQEVRSNGNAELRARY